MTSATILAIFLATLAQFITGAVWYTPLFGKLWGQIHGFDKLDKKTQDKMMSEMKPIFGVQIAVTIITSVVLMYLHRTFPGYSLMALTFWIWLGFVVPSLVSGILFSGTESKWMVTKSVVMAGGSLASLMAGAFVLNLLV
ncbi:MAG: DUF1761 domain-containing protein [Microgenomates group bacterium]